MASEQWFSPEFGRAVRAGLCHSPLVDSSAADAAKEEPQHVLWVVQRLVRQELEDVRRALSHSCGAVDEVQRIVHAELAELRADLTEVRATVTAQASRSAARGDEQAGELRQAPLWARAPAEAAGADAAGLARANSAAASASCEDTSMQQCSEILCLSDPGDRGAETSAPADPVERLESVITFGLAEVREFAQELVARERSAWEGKQEAMWERFNSEVAAGLARHVALLDALNALETRPLNSETRLRQELSELQAALSRVQGSISKHETTLDALAQGEGRAQRDGESRTPRTASKSPERRPAERRAADGRGTEVRTAASPAAVRPTKSASGAAGVVRSASAPMVTRGRGSGRGTGRPRGTF